MEIDFKRFKIRDVVDGYMDNDEDGVTGYGGRLNIRPPYQREFVYSDARRNAVIDSIYRNLPLNTMYWAENEDGTFELLDGQQRTISFCQFCTNEFSMEFRPGFPMMFANLPKDRQDAILDYDLHVYVCRGSDDERLEWFRTINVAQTPLTDQELLNANYTGRWLADAKRRFSKTNCTAYKLASRLVNGTPIRQDYLERALKWITGDTPGGIARYMATHQGDPDALELWTYFRSVIEWVQAKFPVYRKEMKGIEWGILYNRYSANHYDDRMLEKEISRLMADDDVTAKRGIYEYLLSNRTLERKLSIRSFTDSQKRTAYERQHGHCNICGREFPFDDMQGDHIVPWSKGGKTVPENLQMICRECNSVKSDK